MLLINCPFASVVRTVLNQVIPARSLHKLAVLGGPSVPPPPTATARDCLGLAWPGRALARVAFCILCSRDLAGVGSIHCARLRLLSTSRTRMRMVACEHPG